MKNYFRKGLSALIVISFLCANSIFAFASTAEMPSKVDKAENLKSLSIKEKTKKVDKLSLVSIKAIDNCAVEVVFNKKVNISKVNFKITEKYGAKAELEINDVKLVNKKTTALFKTSSQKAAVLYQLEITGMKCNGKAVEPLIGIFVGMAPQQPPVNENGPKLVSVKSLGNDCVEAVFDIQVDITGAVFPIYEKYGIKQELQIIGITQSDDKKTVLLNTLPQNGAVLYELVIKQLKGEQGEEAGELRLPFVGIAAGVPPEDEQAPEVVSVIATENTTVEVVFDIPVNLAEASFTIGAMGGSVALAVNSVVQGADMKTVTLTTAPQTAGLLYELVATGVKSDTGVTASEIRKMFAGRGAPPVGSPDLNITSVSSIGNTSVKVVFSKPVGIEGATFAAAERYIPTASLPVLSTSLSPDHTTVILETASQQAGLLYELKVTGLTTEEGPQNAELKQTFVGIGSIPPPSEIVPAIDYVIGLSNTSVFVAFNTEVDISQAVFSISEAFGSGTRVNITQVNLSPDMKTLMLITDSQIGGTVYKVTITGVKSLTGQQAGELTAMYASVM